MLTTQDTVRNFMVWANLPSNQLSENSAVTSAANTLTDLLKIRIQSKNINEVAQSLLPQTFDLRIKIIDWLTINDNFFDNYFTEIDKFIQSKLHNSLYSELEETQAKVLMLQKQIVTPLAKEIQNDSTDLFNSLGSKKPNYATIKYISKLAPQAIHFKNWIDASLSLELGLILADMIVLNDLKLPENKIKNEIIVFLNDEVVKFGAYSVLIGAWHLPESHDSELINQIEVLVAMKQLEAGSYHEVKKDDLFDFIHN